MIPMPGPQPQKILFVFAWLVVGGEETEVRLLAKNLDPAEYRIEVVACFREDNMPEQVHEQLEALGIVVDKAPYTLSFEDTVTYLARKVTDYDVVVSCQNVADIYPALERLRWRPPLIEHGGLVSEALAGPKHFTSRYVGVCKTIRDAAASRMQGREAHALEIPSMVDLSEFVPADRKLVRASLGVADGIPLIGWVGRLDAKKRVEDFIEAAALVHRTHAQARFVVIGGPDAFMPDYAERLKALAAKRGLNGILQFLGDRKDVPRLLAALDVFVWLSRGEGMPHVIAEAGAAGLAVIATPDNGALEQIEHEKSGLFVPHESPAAVAAATQRLIGDAGLRSRLGAELQAKVAAEYSVQAVVPQWRRLFAEVIAERRRDVPRPNLFRSFFGGGFECSTHWRRQADAAPQRLDMLAAISHDNHAAADYRQLASVGMRTVRDGLRWHLIEREPGRFDWSSFLPMLRAAQGAGTQVIWDLLHYGWPADIDIWKPEFVDRFARFAAAAARVVVQETGGGAFYCPVNEVSFFSWGGGDAAYLNPWARGRGFELKVQLARASIAAMEEILRIDPRARFVHCDPMINVICDPSRPWQRGDASGHHEAQFQGWDMLAGRAWPQIGGREALLDVIGVNYYFNNQWIHAGPPIDWDHPLYKPLHRLLIDVYARYGKPILIAETGTEADRRVPWLQYVCAETRLAMHAGVPIEGICLYPVVNHPGWDDDRDCQNGLFSASIGLHGRTAYQPLAEELARQQALFEEMWRNDRLPLARTG